MILNDPAVVAEVEAAFMVYEKALNENDVAVLDACRYGIGENLYGFGEIAAFRAARPSAGLKRTIERTVITTYGDAFATANTLFRRESMAGKIGRQSQTWVKFPEGWRVVAAHVSAIAE